ncbi:MAG: B12-binding domain-containing radical SAM protein [Calditrichales bacterium]|nr:B12-binding domain-containing radical SAM protein [Calditrichales bacterium]
MNPPPNVLFVNLPSLPFDAVQDSLSGKGKLTQTHSMPMGIMYLSSYLKKYGRADSIGLLDYSRHMDFIERFDSLDNFIKKTAETKLDFTPDILAFSLNFSSSHLFFTKAKNILKQKWPDSIIAVGGTHASNIYRYLLKNESVDYVFRGQAEEAFCQYVNAYPDFTNTIIPGVAGVNNAADSSDAALGQNPIDLDLLPFPDWDLIDMDFYLHIKGRGRKLNDALVKKTATVITTRGCPYHCTFCSAHTTHGRKVRRRSIENILDEFKLLHQKYGVNLFIPEDDAFAINMNRLIKLFEALNTLRIPDIEIQFPNGLSVNSLNIKLVDVLTDAGMEIASLAIESGSVFTQKEIIKKNVNLEKAKQLVDYLKSKNVIVRCFFILGFPGETPELVQDTIDYAKEIQADWSVFNIAAPLVGSEMYNQFVERGDITDDLQSWVNASYSKRSFDTKEFSADALNKIVYRANLEVNFINNPNLIDGNYKKAAGVFTDILSSYPFHIIALECLAKCYVKSNQQKLANEIPSRIEQLVLNDTRAAEMYQEYSEFIKFRFK